MTEPNWGWSPTPDPDPGVAGWLTLAWVVLVLYAVVQALFIRGL